MNEYSRKDFLKLAGMGTLGFALSSCKSPTGPDEPDIPDPVDLAPSLDVLVENAVNGKIFGGNANFKINVSDDNALAQTFLEVDGNRYDLDVAGKTSKETTISHDFDGTGSFGWRAEALDDANQQAVRSGSLEVVAKHRFEVQSRGFWTKEPGFVEELTLRNLDLGEEYILKPDSNGVFSADLYAGLYVLKDVKGKHYDVSRMLVDRDLHPVGDQFKDSNDLTYLVSGLEKTPWLINLNKDMSKNSFHIESLDLDVNEYTNQDLLENLSRLAHRDGFIVTPRFWETQTVVINKGNPDYPDDFDWRRDFLSNPDPSLLPGEGRYPPGTRFGEQELTNAREYVKDMKEIFNSDVVGINPYTLDVVEDTAENLTGYFRSGPPYGSGHLSSILKENVLYIGCTSGPGTESVFFNKTDEPQLGGPLFIDATGMLVPGTIFADSNSWFSNESNHFGTVREAWKSNVYDDGPICSVKDHTSADRYFPNGPNYCQVTFNTPDGRSFKPVDKLAWTLFTGFGPWAGRQLNKEYFKKSDSQILNSGFNASNSEKGFNVYIQKP